MTLPAGSRLGSYEVLGLLGTGGMGEVYRARDRKLGREVAIKVLPDEFALDSGRVARFEREARMLAAVSHSAIAAIYGAEEDGPTRYIVMELVEGDTLADRLSTGPFPVVDALRVASQVAEALEVAHEKGVIHRDLKPANIKLTPENKVKVLDFGLAKAMDLPYSGDMSRTPTVVMGDSRPGEVVGTPEFMSPEQARGKETDRRTDIWSFGCLLFEMLSGRRAFSGETVPDAIASILHHDPDWSVLPARVPARVRELLHRCLEKDAGRRLRDAGDARLELEAAMAEMSGAGAGAIPSAGPWPRWRTVATIAAAAIVVALAMVVGRSLEARRARPATGGRQLAVLPFRNLTNAPEGDLWGVALADTVSARLANLRGLEVVTPRAAGPADARDGSASSVARRLGANTLLEGSLQREKDSFRITYRIIDARGNQIAANALDGTELFALQDRVADSVADDLALKRAGRRTPTPSGLDSPALQERYLAAIGLLQRYDRKDSVEQSLVILEKLGEEKPNSALVLAALARADFSMYALTNDSDWARRAIAAASAARAIDPTLPEVDVTLGETLQVTGRPREAVEAFRRAQAARPGDVQALIGFGRASAKLGDTAGAEAAFRRAADLQPSWYVFNSLAAHYYQLGRYGEAVAMFRRAAEKAPDSAWAQSNLGGAETMSCGFPAAIEAFRRALELDPSYGEAAANLGLTELWIGRDVDAVKHLELAARLSPNNFAVWGNLGDAYRRTRADAKSDDAFRKSIALAQEVLRLNPTDTDALGSFATGLAKLGRLDEAGGPSRRSLEAAGGRDPVVLADAATVAALAGRDADAFALLRQAVALGYCSEILERQPEFARLRETPEFRSIIAAPPKAARTS